MAILFLNLQITRSDVKPHMKWVVSLVIAFGHFNLPQGFVWVCMGYQSHVITPEGTQEEELRTWESIIADWAAWIMLWHHDFPTDTSIQYVHSQEMNQMRGSNCIEVVKNLHVNRHRISSNTAQVSYWTRINLPIQINRAYTNSLDFNLLSIWTRQILGHEIN